MSWPRQSPYSFGGKGVVVVYPRHCHLFLMLLFFVVLLLCSPLHSRGLRPLHLFPYLSLPSTVVDVGGVVIFSAVGGQMRLAVFSSSALPPLPPASFIVYGGESDAVICPIHYSVGCCIFYTELLSSKQQRPPSESAIIYGYPVSKIKCGGGRSTVAIHSVPRVLVIVWPPRCSLVVWQLSIHYHNSVCAKATQTKSASQQHKKLR